MAEENQYHVELRIDVKGPTPARLVYRALESIEAKIVAIERSELEELFEFLGDDIDHRTQERCLASLERQAGQAFYLDDVRQGSIIITGLIAGLGYWVLQNTLGETFKEAWLESDLHRKIKGFFLKRIDKKLSSMGKELEESIIAHSEDFPAGTETSAREEGYNLQQIHMFVPILGVGVRPPILSRPVLDYESLLSPGDAVVVINQEELSVEDKMKEPLWVPEMDKYSGELAVVRESPGEGISWILLDVDVREHGAAPGGGWFWHRDWLGKLTNDPFTHQME